MSAPDEKKEFGEPKVGAGKKSFKGKKQAGDPPGYAPGKYQAKITARTIKMNSVENQLYFDLLSSEFLGTSLANNTYSEHTRQDPNNYEPRNVWVELCNCTVAFAMFKQFCSALPVHESHLVSPVKVLLDKRVQFPIGLMPIIRQYGHISDDLGDYRLVGQVGYAYTLMMRAVADLQETYNGVIQQVDRQRSFCLYAECSNPWHVLIEMVRGIVNQWCLTHQLRCDSNGQTFFVNGVTLEGGFDLFYNAFQTSNFPLHVIRALRIGVIAEGALRLNPVPVGNGINAGLINALNGEGVVVLGWSRAYCESRFVWFVTFVQDRIFPTLDAAFSMGELGALDRHGHLSQLVGKESFELMKCPRPLSGEDVEMGAMMSQRGNGVDNRIAPFQVETDVTSSDAISKWFYGMRKGRKGIKD